MKKLTKDINKKLIESPIICENSDNNLSNCDSGSLMEWKDFLLYLKKKYI